jgi:hypothetical protein
MMEQTTRDGPAMLDIAALLADLPVKGLVRGQVGVANVCRHIFDATGATSSVPSQR